LGKKSRKIQQGAVHRNSGVRKCTKKKKKKKKKKILRFKRKILRLEPPVEGALKDSFAFKKINSLGS
jgi:hypothetical protein